jgi:alpha/beta superfamily hydrolase
MDNKVVTTLMRGYRDLGVAVVRFNFRGVAASEGQYDDGVGEVEDLLAVVAEVRRLRPHAPLYLAGFSFGAAVAANACARIKALRHVVLVAPPVPRYQLTALQQLAAPAAVLQGVLDERVQAADVAAWAQALPEVSYRELPEAGHFFHGQLGALKAALMQAVEGATHE